MLTSFMREERDDTASEAASANKMIGDYFFLFESQVENRFAKPRRESRRKRMLRRFSRRRGNKQWRNTRMLLYDHPSPDTTALMSEDEHSLIHSHAPDNAEDDCERLAKSESRPNIVWPETMSLVGGESSEASVTPTRNNRKRKVLMKNFKARMRKSLIDSPTKSRSCESDDTNVEEYVVKDEKEDVVDKSSAVSLLERAKRSFRASGMDAQRAKALLHEDVGFYVHSRDQEIEIVYKSSFEQLCVPSFREQRDSPPSVPDTASLDDGCAVAHLIHQGKTSLAVKYDSDFAQLELQSDDEYDPEDDDASFADDPALPALPSSGSEETEYNLFNQSSVEEDNEPHKTDYPSLLPRTSTVSEDPSLFDGAAALDEAFPLPQCRNVLPKVVVSCSSDEGPLFVQDSTSTEGNSRSSRRLGATPALYSLSMPQGQEEIVMSSSSDEEEQHDHLLGIACPTYTSKTALEDATDVWKRIYAPPVHTPPSPTVVQKSRATWSCEFDALPISVSSDISEKIDVARPNQQNPFYNIRRYVASCGVMDEEEHPFDEVDSNARAPLPTRLQEQERHSSPDCGVTELVRGINVPRRESRKGPLTHDVMDEQMVARPRCECVKCSVSSVYASLLAKK